MQRYMQQIIVPELGVEGQKKLAAATVLIIGAGGLGTPLAIYLSTAGIGTIGIVDGDNVVISNLSRQFLYTEKEIGQQKASLLAAKLMEQNSALTVNTCTEMLSEKNAETLIEQYDIICDCTDNVQSRVLIDKICGQREKPLIYAVVGGWEGYVTVFHHTSKKSLENIFTYESLLENQNLACSGTGIINSICGIAGSIQAAEVIKIILGISSELDGGILVFNAMGPHFRVLKLH